VRLFLGIPTAGSPSAPFLASLAHLRLPEDAHEFERTIVTGNFIPAQRDLLVERALDWGADAIAMCDDDMVLPPDALTNLCAVLRDDPRAGIAGALYYSRDGLRPMVVSGWDSQDTSAGWIPAFDDRTPVAVDGVGFGCVVIRSDAIRTLEPPYFPAQIYVERSDARVRVCNEDYLFCERLRGARHSVFLHPGVRCGHYDRARDRIAPAAWEPAERTNQRRILTRTGEAYALVPLEGAPAATESAMRRRRADVVYVETP
jgi:GT2 family glycosyltransferase